MKPFLHFVLATAALLALGAPPAVSDTVTYKIVSNMGRFDQPFGLLEGSPGAFYLQSGSATVAVISVTAGGSKTILATFDGQTTERTSLLVSAANERFYSGIATKVHNGAPNQTVFSVDQTPKSKEVYPPQQFVPVLAANLPDGHILGFAPAVATNLYNLYTSDLRGSLTTIYQFPSGVKPLAALLAADGSYYGVAMLQDGSGSGYAFRFNARQSLVKLYTFTNLSFTLYPASMIQADDGSLYGTTPIGGTNGNGTVYKLSPSGQYTLLYAFPKGNNGNPSNLIEGSDGNLYGATLGNLGQGGHSELFRVTKTGSYTLLYAMTDMGRDGGCTCLLLQGSDGNIYGTARIGGRTGAGAVFSLNAGLPKPAPRLQTFQPKSGAAGTKILLWGSNLLSAAVQFNGVPAASVSNSGSNYVWATVPAGATSGPITLTTPGGTSTTTASFAVQ
jgi:uncharacterized repeat protein (TIGR03803 family)